MSHAFGLLIYVCILLQNLGVVPKEENKNFLTFVIPHEKEALLTVRA